MDLVESARKYLGVKFQHQGRYPWALDCGGLLVLSAKDEGVELEDIKGYARMPDGFTLQAALEKQFKRVSDMQSGDVLLMRFEREPQHIAIKTDIGIIHSYQDAKKVTEHNLDDKWKKRILAVYRYE